MNIHDLNAMLYKQDKKILRQDFRDALFRHFCLLRNYYLDGNPQFDSIFNKSINRAYIFNNVLGFLIFTKDSARNCLQIMNDNDSLSLVCFLTDEILHCEQKMNPIYSAPGLSYSLSYDMPKESDYKSCFSEQLDTREKDMELLYSVCYGLQKNGRLHEKNYLTFCSTYSFLVKELIKNYNYLIPVYDRTKGSGKRGVSNSIKDRFTSLELTLINILIIELNRNVSVKKIYYYESRLGNYLSKILARKGIRFIKEYYNQEIDPDYRTIIKRWIKRNFPLIDKGTIAKLFKDSINPDRAIGLDEIKSNVIKFIESHLGKGEELNEKFERVFRSLLGNPEEEETYDPNLIIEIKIYWKNKIFKTFPKGVNRAIAIYLCKDLSRMEMVRKLKSKYPEVFHGDLKQNMDLLKVKISRVRHKLR